MERVLSLIGEGAFTALGFFWKAAWAFVLGYFISAMIRVFVPKKRLVEKLGRATPKSIALTTVFGAASSSCSFAALAAARSLVVKGAHFIVAVAFMFASTNLVIELGVLILIFLGWPFLLAELLGGVLLIAISALLIRVTYPSSLLASARERAEEGAKADEEEFDWRERMRSREGWQMVGHHFVMDWQMVYKEIVIGFTVAGFMATLVPKAWWSTLFMTGADAPAWLVAVENALIAPFVAAATFIGSMGNIPLATVLSAQGVMFAGIMAFIYADLVVPPLVSVNAKYYGWKAALYIAGVMYVSMVATSLLLSGGYHLVGWVPESGMAVDDVVRFAFDYTFWLNAAFAAVAAGLIYLHRRHQYAHGAMNHDMEGDGPLKTLSAAVAAVVLVGGLVLRAVETL